MSEAPETTGAPDPFRGDDWLPARSVEPGTEPPARRRRRVSRRRLRRRRHLGIAMLVLGGLVVLVGAYLALTGLAAKHQLERASAEVKQLNQQIGQGDLAGARATAASLRTQAHKAHSLTTGPVWSLAAHLPGGAPLQTVRAITAQIDGLGSDVLPQLVTASTKLDPDTLRRSDGSLDLARISAVAPVLDSAVARMSRATAVITAQPAHTWLGSVDSARSDLLGRMSSLDHSLRSADLAADAAPAMLGAAGVKRYFVAFQNDAEARGTGGIPGAFAIVRVDKGKFTFERFEPDDTMRVQPVGVDLGTDFDQMFGGMRTHSLYVNTNLSPNFPYAAQLWLAMWRAHSGERLDGAIAVDPTTLSYLLGVTGPATLTDGTKISAGNVVALTQSGVYAKFPAASDQTARKAYLLDIARAVAGKILGTTQSTKALVKAGGRAAGERRLLVYSTDPALEATLKQTSLSGAIPQTAAPYAGVSIVNVGGNKLDYYLDRSLTWTRSGCGAVRAVTATITLRNNAPASGLSPYVTARADRAPYPTKPGDNRLAVSYYATPGASLTSVELDGKPGLVFPHSALGHPVYVVDLELPRGTTRTITLHLIEPVGTGSPAVLRQPLVRPLKLSMQDARCD
ncbi:MAG: hypothetical protein QOE97_2062 [Pseudonocardiales bacterium]|nr:hypothetical protein [Pseudonocardiales bacterium]